jgi:hypothetical protein
MIPIGSLRVRGVREHLERARFFFDLANKEKDLKSAHRFMLAAVYSCRAIADLMLEAAEKQEIKSLSDPDPKKNRAVLESQISTNLPYYDLLERIRIHDFHRFGLVPPDSKFKVTMFGGPMKLTASKGGAAVSVTGQGPKVSTTGGSHVKFQRPLLTQDSEFFDDDSAKFVKLGEVLKAFLKKAPDVVSEFEKLVA